MRALRFALAALLLLAAGCASAHADRYAGAPPEETGLFERMSPVAEALGALAVQILYALASAFGSVRDYRPGSR